MPRIDLDKLVAKRKMLHDRRQAAMSAAADREAERQQLNIGLVELADKIIEKKVRRPKKNRVPKEIDFKKVMEFKIPEPIIETAKEKINRVDFEKLNRFLSTHIRVTGLEPKDEIKIDRPKAEYTNSSPYGVAQEYLIEQLKLEKGMNHQSINK
jgi:hypothetical protein